MAYCLNPQIYEGTAQIQRLIISREHLGRFKQWTCKLPCQDFHAMS